MYYELSLRITGFILSLLLTFGAYFIILNPQFLSNSTETSILFIFALALIQAFVQLIFFINVWKEEGPLWNLSVFLSTVSIIFVIIYFSIWIINHLNYNMR